MNYRMIFLVDSLRVTCENVLLGGNGIQAVVDTGANFHTQ